MGTPGFGVLGGGYPLAGEWEVSVGWRYQKSDRHYVGSEYQGIRDQIGNQVRNSINLADLSVRYQATRRTDVNFGVPYFMGTRSQMLRSNGVNLERFQTNARGIGDVMVTTHRWMFDPDTHTKGNLQFGTGVKIPTGADNVTDTFRTVSGGVISNVIRTVDQSIQPGDGGFGLLAEVNGFMRLTKSGLSVYGSGDYLSSPQEKSNVLTYRSAPGEDVMSIADQYLVRGGVAMPVPKVKNVQFSLGIRAEGVPSHDLIGGSKGFRRPGIAVSLEPVVNIGRGRNSITLGVPVAMYRNRFISVPDEANGTHGDAAFANYLVLAGFSRRF